MKHVSWTNPRQFLSKAWIIIDFMGLKQKEFILNHTGRIRKLTDIGRRVLKEAVI